ncbi:hypothetical protein BKI52_32415 [marine bacterium AO1-C]|nr:hypothetical protein BKI52_32415 [marine bacterium AO1-C]
MNTFSKYLFSAILLLCVQGVPLAQQLADKTFRHSIAKPSYASGQGSLVLIDEAHHNFHKLDGRFYAFAQLLRDDGYVLRANQQSFTKQKLDKCKILVIANAIHPKNQGTWALPAYSAFTNEEIKAIKQWVYQGGRLLLIADHMPFPGAAYDLAKTFGFEMNNGFARRIIKKGERRKLDRFNRQAKTLKNHAITNGVGKQDKINEIISFTGQAFKPPTDAKPLIVFPKGYETLMPDTAWAFRPHTKRLPIDGWVQGATLEYGKGRMVVFGEAAMFTSQEVNRNGRKFRFGMSHPQAKQNPQFVLNVIRWLDGKLE